MLSRVPSTIAVSSLIGQGSTWIFQVVAYRLDDTSPELIRMMHDLYLAKQQKTKAEKTVQKIRKVPKSLRAGTPPKRVNVKRKALDDTLNRAAESKDMRQKASAIGDLLKTTGAVR